MVRHRDGSLDRPPDDSYDCAIIPFSGEPNMSEAPPAIQEQQNATREAIEKHIGMLTCQVVDLSIRLEFAQREMGRMVEAINERDAELAKHGAASKAE